MFNYIIRRLVLLPITLFFIILVNFVIINLAPGDPTTVTEVGSEGATRRQDKSVAFGSDNRYLQFREFYGLTLPILWNSWPWIDQGQVDKTLWTLVHHRWTPEDPDQMEFKKYDQLRVKFGDQARYIMPLLLNVIENDQMPLNIRKMASRFFVRGGTHQAYLGGNLSQEQKAFNIKIAKDNELLASLVMTDTDDQKEVRRKVEAFKEWYEKNKTYYDYEKNPRQKLYAFFFETRFFKYMSRVLLLDFGTLRNDPNRTVISEVTSRFKYSLTLSILPMLATFFLCQFFGFLMAYNHNRWPDYTFNLIFLVLYAIPIFVVAPFLIEKVALNGYFPFTQVPIPISGFTSPDAIYDKLNSYQRLIDILKHIALPLLAIMYGTLAVQARISRTAVLEVLRHDYVRTAKAKGLSSWTILTKHVGRNAAITIVTSIAGSLGVILGGSLIVETLFEINGFGKFFYDAILNRDYNVIMFSALASAFLALLGYLVADLAYTLLDPRVTLD